MVQIPAPPPAVTFTVNGVTVASNNNAVNDSGKIVSCTSPLTLTFSNIGNADGSGVTANEKIRQEFVLNNVVWVGPTPTNADVPLSAFAGTFIRNIALVNPVLSGSLIMRFRSYLDLNNNNTFDGGDTPGDVRNGLGLLDLNFGDRQFFQGLGLNRFNWSAKDCLLEDFNGLRHYGF